MGPGQFWILDFGFQIYDLDCVLTIVNQKSSLVNLVDLRGFEPLTSSVRLRRAPNCATGPLFKVHRILPEALGDVNVEILVITHKS